MAPQWLTLTDLDHVGAAAEADLVLRLDHHFDARQVVWQMAKTALGWRPPGCAVGIARHVGIAGGRCFSDSRLKVFKSQLAIVGVQLFGLLAVKGVTQFGDQIILAFGLGAQTRHFGLHDQKRLSHDRRKRIQIKGMRGGGEHAASYPIRSQKPIFTGRSGSFCRSRNGRSRCMNAAPIEPGKQRLKLHP